MPLFEYTKITYMSNTTYEAEVIAVAIHKGGVAKTTSVINIGASLARKGFKTLILDCDPQCNASSVYKTFLSEGVGTVFDLMEDAEVKPTHIKENLFIIPADLRMEAGEIYFGSRIAKESILSQAIEPYFSQFDYILIDTPPSLGLFTKNALAASDFVLMPLNPEKFAVEGYIQMEGLVKDIKKQLNPDLEILGMFFSKTKRTIVHTDLMEEVRGEVKFHVFDTHISEKAAVSECVVLGHDIESYAEMKKEEGDKNIKFSAPAKENLALVNEILERIETYS